MSKKIDPVILIFFAHQLSEVIHSGGEKMFLEVSKRIEALDIELYSVIPQLTVEPLKQEGVGYKTFVLPCFGFEYQSYQEGVKDLLKMLWILFYRNYKCMLSIRSWIQQSKANLLYSTGDFYPNVLPPCWAKLFDRKLTWVVLVHHIIDNPFQRKGMGFFSNVGSFLMQRFSFFFIRRFADGVFLKNKEVHDFLANLNFDPNKMFIIDNGVDLQKIAAYPKAAEGFDGCYIGRLTASKGVDDLIHIWKGVCKSKPEARLAIIGGGSEKMVSEKKLLVKQLGLKGRVMILGSLSDAEAFGIRKASRFSLSCSYEEGWGITIAESLACGVPTVVYDLPVYQEKFADAVVTIPKGNIELFSQKLLELWDDEQALQRLSEAGIKQVKKYDINQVVQDELQVMQQLLNKNLV